MRAGLTKRQAETLTFIAGFIRKKGYSPSYAEIAIGIGTAHKSEVHRIVHALRDRGAITFVEGAHRSIYVPGVAA